MSKKRVLVIGCGNMGASHAKAYHNHDGFEICGLVSRGEKDILNNSSGNYHVTLLIMLAISHTKPDAVCIINIPRYS